MIIGMTEKRLYGAYCMTAITNKKDLQLEC